MALFIVFRSTLMGLYWPQREKMGLFDYGEFRNTPFDCLNDQVVEGEGPRILTNL